MKSVKQVQKEIEEISIEIRILDKSKEKRDISAAKRLRKKIPQLKEYVLYLKTEPTEDYCKKEVARISNRINEIMKLYEPLDAERFMKSQVTAHKKQFEKMWELPKIRKQLMSISYLLG